VEISCVSTTANDLGESPCWDSKAGRLYWIDAWRSQVHAFDPRSRQATCFDFGAALGGLPIGSIAAREAGGLVGGVKGGFYQFDLEPCGARLIAAVEQDRPPTNRLNDGKCDRAGRFWCASVNTDHRTASGALWRLDPAGVATLMCDGLVVGNGIAWSPDDRRMYLADTFSGTVWQFDFDLATGALANRRPFTSTEFIRGYVDGAAIDADGCYWAALFGGGAVAQFDPDGKLMRHVALPVLNPTMCTFGGADLDILYVTSASRFLDEEQRRKQPLAGHLFAIHGLEARGLPQPRFHG
jgi:sugar lactone lactonase YvrE